MRAFRIDLNGKVLCHAGIGNEGVLTAIVRYVTKSSKVKGRSRDDLGLDVGGLIGATQEHVNWRNIRLKVGDEVLVKVIEAVTVDKPEWRHGIDPVKDLKARKRYVLEMAKELGWKVTTGRAGSRRSRTPLPRIVGVV
ncbi:MAG TPA: hypothetical protein VKV95_11705 [Terriglobia bacterium]|nr:hypothetical protein [Terriglobia bacterium]